MKIITSHDVDHLTVWEHLTKDTIIPKFIIRAHIELLGGKISLREYLNRVGDFFKNKWNGVEEVISFNKSRDIKSTFFVGVNNGVGLSYPLNFVSPVIKRIIDSGFEVGVHGIDYDSFEKVKKEFDTFQTLSGQNKFGIRMHYLRTNNDTYRYMEKSGYLYDATERGMKNPYKIGNMWEFPLQIMDGWMMDGEKRWQTRNLEEAKKETIKLINEASENNLRYLSILFHDRYFSNSFVTWKNWYIWLIDYLLENNYRFITHEDAIRELEGDSFS